MTNLELLTAWALTARNRPGPARASREVIEAVCALCEAHAAALAMNKREFADALGVRAYQVSRWEAGAAELPTATMAAAGAPREK